MDTSDLEQVRAALRPNTKMIYAETPANPILRIADIAALAEIAHEAGALLAVELDLGQSRSYKNRSPWARTSSSTA